MSGPTPAYIVSGEAPKRTLALSGDWTVSTLHRIGDLEGGTAVIDTLDVSGLGRLDTAGALAVLKLLPESGPVRVVGDHSSAEQLIGLVRQSSAPCDPVAAKPGSIMDLFERTGRGTVQTWRETQETLAFLGEALFTVFRLILNPGRLRWTPTVAIMEDAGLDALPIVAFLSFFVGMVVAFIGASSLADLGATIFAVELTGIAMMRELGVLMTGIILAGRTNSAFTAQIGAMRMRQEIDAMTTLGLSPMEVLVAPRIIAMAIMTPVLAFVATLSGILGGLVVGWLTLDISPIVFAARVQDYVPTTNFWVGLSKAPLFGLVVALIGCRQGLEVGGSVQSLGHHTTTSVVQAIFSIIVIDAVFAIFYMELGV